MYILIIHMYIYVHADNRHICTDTVDFTIQQKWTISLKMFHVFFKCISIAYIYKYYWETYVTGVQL